MSTSSAKHSMVSTVVKAGGYTGTAAMNHRCWIFKYFQNWQTIHIFLSSHVCVQLSYFSISVLNLLRKIVPPSNHIISVSRTSKESGASSHTPMCPLCLMKPAALVLSLLTYLCRGHSTSFLRPQSCIWRVSYKCSSTVVLMSPQKVA